MREILPELHEWVERGDQIALATVVGVRRSAPRPPGAKMAVNQRGEVAGSVSGGCVEAAVATVADAVLAGSPPQLVSFGIPDADAWEVGLPCGGEVDVWVERFHPGGLVKAAMSGARLAEVTLLEGAGAGAKITIDPDGARQGTLGAPDLDDEAVRLAGELLWSERSERHGPLFVDVVAPPPRLILFGATDVAAAVCRLARAAGWRPYVVDPRTRFASPKRFADVAEVITAWPEQALARLGGIDPATSIAVLTHDPKLDDAALLLALRSPARFVGAMGSWRAQASRHARLLDAGLTEEELDRLAAPIGLDLGAVDRDETALSIFAEIVAARHGRQGGRLKHGWGSVHEIEAEIG